MNRGLLTAVARQKQVVREILTGQKCRDYHECKVSHQCFCPIFSQERISVWSMSKSMNWINVLNVVLNHWWIVFFKYVGLLYISIWCPPYWHSPLTCILVDLEHTISNHKKWFTRVLLSIIQAQVTNFLVSQHLKRSTSRTVLNFLNLMAPQLLTGLMG